MSTKHTPGPWMAEQDQKGRWRVYCDAYSDEAPLVAKGSQVWPMSEEDAHLIAAAPDLLEALRALAGARDVTYYDDSDRSSGTYQVCIVCHEMAEKASEIAHDASCIVGKARAAIAKAEGRS